MKRLTGKPNQTYKIWVKFSGKAKFELSSNEQRDVNHAKMWDRNVSVGRGTTV